MILTTHLLVGAAIASKVSNPILGPLLALLSHYLLDLLPHTGNPAENIRSKNWRSTLPEFMRIGTDFFAGILFILILADEPLAIFAGAFFAVLPDTISFWRVVWPNRIANRHQNWHEKIHFWKNKKIPIFWKILTQVAVATLAILVLR